MKPKVSKPWYSIYLNSNLHNIFHFNQFNRDNWVRVVAKEMRPGSIILDLGAGGTPYRSYFSHCDYKTQDICVLNHIQLIQGGYGNIDYICDASQIPVSGSTFDAVLSTEVIEHVPEPIKVIQEISRILKPGGKLFLTAPLGSGLHQKPHHYYGGYTPFWYEKFLADYGFRDIKITANGGSFKHFSQWCIWFLKNSNPVKLKTSLINRLMMLPIWVIIVPMTFFIFFGSYIIDSFDEEKNFTVGYHVQATKI